MSNETNFPNNSNHPQSANIPVSSLAPFTRFCCSLGMIPSSYKASMSYEEQLMWLCDYLENTVIPTVNNNTEATNEIQELFNELHDYVENYFTNLDVQQEINNKLDTMAEDGTLISIIGPYLQPFIDIQNNKIQQLENFVHASTNINPLVASSISEMTDTTRIYVLTTDGHWYYYNGTAWADGGAYQSTGIADNSINYKKLNNELQNMEGIREITPVLNNGGYSYNGGLSSDSNFCYSDPISLKAGETIRVKISGYQSQSAIILYYNENTPIQSKDVLIVSNPASSYYEYTAQQDMKVIFSGYRYTFEYCVIYNKQNSINQNYNKNIFNNMNYLITKNTSFSGLRTQRNINNYDNDMFDKELQVTVNSDGSLSSNFNYTIYKKIEFDSEKTINKLSIVLDLKSDENLPIYAYLYNGTLSQPLNQTLAMSRRFIDASRDYKRFIIDINFPSPKTLNSFVLILGANFTTDPIVNKNLYIRLLGCAYDTDFFNIINNPYTIKDKTILLNNLNKNAFNETISILGDSFSTYGGWTPDGYKNWYKDEGNSGNNNVDNVNQTWWYKLLQNYNKNLLVNCSYSGSTISHNGYAGNPASTSFIERMKTWIGEQRKTDSKPSLIIIMGGTNDYFTKTELGSLKYSNWTNEDFNKFAPSVCYMLDYLKKWNPSARIINYIPYTISNDMKQVMIDASIHYNVEYLIIPSNTSYSDGHPNQNGMNTIYENLANYLLNQ